MKKRFSIKVGDKFIAEENNFHAGYTIVLEYVYDGQNLDGYGFWTSRYERDRYKKMGLKNPHGNRIHFKARAWWFKEHCKKLK